MQVQREVHSFTPEVDAFHDKSRPLFYRAALAQPNVTACSDDAVPWEAICRVCAQQACDGAMKPWVAGCGCNGTIGADLARRHGQDHPSESFIPQVTRSLTFAQQRTLRMLEVPLR